MTLLGLLRLGNMRLMMGAAAATASGAQSSPPPPPPTPEWVNADGTVDESKIPEAMPLIGADGKDANGKTLKVKTRGLFKLSGPLPSRVGPHQSPGRSVPLRRTRTGG